MRDENCERIKLSRGLYDMGMKVAAVSMMCQDVRVFDAMLMAGTPCPFKGKIGDEALEAWNLNSAFAPMESILEKKDDIAGMYEDAEGNEVEYQVYNKSDFCAARPDESVCSE